MMFDVEPAPETFRPSLVMWLRIGALCAIGMLVTACGGSAIAPALESSSLPVSCSSVALSITMTGGTVRVVNTGNQPCALAGVHPVEVPWWRMIGPGPSPAAGILSPGSALVQSYKGEGGNGCPWTDAEEPAQIGITVEGHVYAVDLPAKLVHEIRICDSVSALPPTIQPPTHAAS
jgi:hypothetical protein